MPTDWPNRAHQIATRLPRICEVAGCKLPTYKVGRMCLPHRQQVRDKGHPTAGRVSIVELRPWHQLALHFVLKQDAAKHPGILAAVEFLAFLTRTAPDAADRAGRWTRPHERVSIYLALLRRDAVDVRSIIAWGIACELHRMLHPRRWPDASHAAYQFGMAVACMARKRVRSGASIGRTHDAFKKSAGYIRELARTLRDPLLPLFVKAAKHLHDATEHTAHPVSAAALHHPFTTTNNEATA